MLIRYHCLYLQKIHQRGMAIVKYHWDQTIVVPSSPVKPDDFAGNYLFAGWDKEVSTICQGSITYTAVYALKYTPGDLDGNEGITSDDAVYLLMNTFFPETYPLDQPADFDGNGTVTSDDAVYLLMHTFFQETYPLTEVTVVPVVMASSEPKRDEEE